MMCYANSERGAYHIPQRQCTDDCELHNKPQRILCFCLKHIVVYMSFLTFLCLHQYFLPECSLYGRGTPSVDVQICEHICQGDLKNKCVFVICDKILFLNNYQLDIYNNGCMGILVLYVYMFTF